MNFLAKVPNILTGLFASNFQDVLGMGLHLCIIYVVITVKPVFYDHPVVVVIFVLLSGPVL